MGGTSKVITFTEIPLEEGDSRGEDSSSSTSTRKEEKEREREETKLGIT
jgi:hypothetical protein